MPKTGLRRLALLTTMLAAMPAMSTPALAEQDAEVRVGTHDGYGRVVFEFPQPVAFQVAQADNAATLHFQGAGIVPGSNRTARNVTSVQGGASQARIAVAPGTRVRTATLGNRVIVDVLDPGHSDGEEKPGARPERHRREARHMTPLPTATSQAHPVPAATAAAAPSPVPAHVPTAAAAARPPAAGPVPAAVSVLAPPPAPATAPLPATATAQSATPPAPAAVPASAVAPEQPATPPVAVSAPVTPVTQTSLPPDGIAVAPPVSQTAATLTAPVGIQPPAPAEPVGIAATHADLPPGVEGNAALLPFARTVGAAAFRRGDTAWVVFDERRPIDLAALQDDPVLAKATVQLLTTATLLRLPLAAGSELRLSHEAAGWRIAALPAAPPLTPIIPINDKTQMHLAAASSSQVVVVPDPATGENLLVGTLRDKPAGVAVTRQVPDFVLPPTWQGVVVEPVSDRVSLRVTPDGFAVDTGGAALSPQPSAAGALSDAAFLTRRFDFPDEPPATLLRRLQAQVDAASAAPAQSRAAPRKAAAQTMIALGMGAEAQAMLSLATQEDPRLANDVDAAGLSAVAALLAGRDSQAAALAEPALNGTDEIALWRAVRAAMKDEHAPEAAPIFATTMPLILSYPSALRDRLLPLAAETMALGHAPEAADALLAKLPDAPSLAYARALRQQAKGNAAAALAAYDVLAAGRDRLTSARAAKRAILLRLDTGAMTPAQAATALEGQFLAWRGDRRERDLRLRVVDLRAQAGAWRPAFDMLRETASLYPGDADMIHARMAALMTTLLTGPGAATISPIDMVELAEENADAMATAPEQAMQLLADKLVALDLPKRAGPVLETLMHGAPLGPTQARLGLRLAKMRFDDGDDAGARTALLDSRAENLPPDLLEERVLLGARVTARQGHPDDAAATLAELGTAAADDLRGTILTEAHEWRGAEAALRDLVAKTVPAIGPLNPAEQDALLRFASDCAMAGDSAALRALSQGTVSRIAEPRAATFRLLTEAPVGSVSDLGRSASEVALAKALPAGLAVIGAQ